MSQLRVRAKEADEACAQATDLARGAAEDMAGAGWVGEHLGIQADGDRVVTHLFSCLDPAYQGWRWAVTVARASWAKNVTVSESLLLPGPEAILAPDWVPWSERLLPGDLGVGDILPAPADDARLVPVASLEGDDGVADWGEATWAAAVSREPGPPEPGGIGIAIATGALGVDADADEAVGGLPAAAAAADEAVGEDKFPGRARVLSAIGRDTTAARWYASEHGPRTPLAHAAPGLCAGCGFFVRLAGPLGQVFGVCANAYAPDDGRVVAVDHGCGAHSEAVFAPVEDRPSRPVIDELGYDVVDLPTVAVDETVFEPLEHA